MAKRLLTGRSEFGLLFELQTIAGKVGGFLTEWGVEGEVVRSATRPDFNIRRADVNGGLVASGMKKPETPVGLHTCVVF